MRIFLDGKYNIYDFVEIDLFEIIVDFAKVLMVCNFLVIAVQHNNIPNQFHNLLEAILRKMSNV